MCLNFLMMPKQGAPDFLISLPICGTQVEEGSVKLKTCQKTLKKQKEEARSALWQRELFP